MWVTSSRHHCAWRAAITSVLPVSERCSAPNWRMVSRSRKRRPNGPDSTISIDRSTRSPRRSSTSTWSRSQIQIDRPTIVSAATRSNGPAKIDSHRNIACCGGVSRSYDHWMVARSVRWRSTLARRPPVRSRRRSSRRSTRSAGERLLVRAAASSMASGTPSRRRQISSTSSRLADGSNVGEAADRPLVEQLDARPGGFEGCDGDELLVAEAEALSRRGEHPDVRAALGDGVGQVGRTVDDVFAVVEDEQRSARLQRRHDRLGQRPPQALLHVQDAGHRPGHLARRAVPGELDEPGAAPGVDVGPLRGRQGEPRLADPSRPHERHDRGVGERVVDDLQVRRRGRSADPGDEGGSRGGCRRSATADARRRRVGGCAARRRRRRGGTSRGHAGCSRRAAPTSPRTPASGRRDRRRPAERATITAGPK